MEYLEFILYPLIYLMRFFIEFSYNFSASYGFSIISLSIVVTIITNPLSIWGNGVQKRALQKQRIMQPEIDKIKAKLKGEKRFFAIEDVYKKHHYHPIHSIKSIAGLAPQIPFLLSALLLLWHYEPLVGTSFFFLADLSKVDALLFGFNLLPFAMLIIGILEVFIRKDLNQSSKINVLIVNIVILVLVYPLPCAVLLYWISNNIISLLKAIFSNSKNLA